MKEQTYSLTQKCRIGSDVFKGVEEFIPQLFFIVSELSEDLIINKY